MGDGNVIIYYYIVVLHTSTVNGLPVYYEKMVKGQGITHRSTTHDIHT